MDTKLNAAISSRNTSKYYFYMENIIRIITYSRLKVSVY